LVKRLRRRCAAEGETHRYIFTVHALDVERLMSMKAQRRDGWL
jgi:phosphatidylethanolamine-binding protein (PEBP) family uncharacterized protein